MRPLDPARFRIAVGRRVAELREQAGLTQDALAERLDVSVKYIQRIERGVENLGLDSLVRLANALRTVPLAFFAPADPTRPKAPASGATPPRRHAKRANG